LKAVLITEHGSSDVLKLKDIEDPICSAGKIKINIKASSVNHLDIWVRQGIPGMEIPLPMILGSDGAGVVTEVGAEVSAFKVGDRVVVQPGLYDANCRHVKEGNENYSNTYGILGETKNGVQCDYVVLKPENIHLMSDLLSFEEAASMQLVFMTAYQMLVERAFLKPYEIVLIYGATSGVGAAAIQIAKDIGAKVITTVGSKSKIDYALELGADYVFNHSEPDCLSKIKTTLKNKRLDVIFEHVGLKTWEISMKLLGRGGRLVTCGATTGHNVNIDLRYLFSKQQSIIGSTMSNIATFKEVQNKIALNIYKPFVDKIYPLSDIKHAHMRVENRKHLGKVVLSL